MVGTSMELWPESWACITRKFLVCRASVVAGGLDSFDTPARQHGRPLASLHLTSGRTSTKRSWREGESTLSRPVEDKAWIKLDSSSYNRAMRIKSFSCGNLHLSAD